MAEPYGCSLGELVWNRHSWPIFMPGQSLIGSVATFDSSNVTWPEKPGSIHPAVECVSRPNLPKLDLPSRRMAMSSGSETTSYVDPRTNSPGCRTKGSLPSVSTRRVRSACSIAGSMWGYLWFSKTLKYRSRRTSTLEGWTSSGANGSILTRPDAICARMSLSESNTQATYRFRYHVVAALARARRFACYAPSAPRAARAGVVQWQNVSFPS